jgi:cytosine/adenosine deaminase-related metal-dependent hydrolase
VSLTVTNALLDGERTRLRVEDGASAKIGPRIRPRDGDEVIDADGMAIVPGLINGHTHAAMTLFRGHGDDLPLMRWLQEVIWPVEARLDDEDVYWGTRLACVEMIRTGTVRFWDMYWHAGATARAVEDAGIRARIAAPLFDLGDAAGPDGVPEMAARGFEGRGIAPGWARRWRRTRSTRSAGCAGRRRRPGSWGCPSTSTSPRRSRR